MVFSAQEEEIRHPSSVLHCITTTKHRSDKSIPAPATPDPRDPGLGQGQSLHYTPETELAKLKETLRRLTTSTSSGTGDDVVHQLSFSNTINKSPSKPAAALMTSSSSSTTTESKAVLTALRTLQDKVRRIEGDRQVLENQNRFLQQEIQKNQTRHGTELKQAEFDLAQAQERAHRQMEEHRLAYEQLKLQYTHELEQKKTSVAEQQQWKTMYTSTKATCDELRQTIAETSHEKAKFQHQAQALQSWKDQHICDEERHLVQTRALKQELEKTQHQLVSLSQEHAELKMQAKASDSSIESLSKTNERMMNQFHAQTLYYQQQAQERLAQAQAQAQAQARQQAKTKKTKPKAKPLRQRPTLRQPQHQPPTKQPTRISGSSSGMMKSRLGSKAKSKSVKTRNKTNHERLRVANKGEIPFILSSSVEPSFSVIASVQETLAKSDASRRLDIQIPAPAPAWVEHAKEKDQVDDPLARAVASVETEFQDLNRRYATLVDQMRTGGASAGGLGPSTSTNTNTTSSSSSSFDDLDQLMKDLKVKERQLHWIKSAQETSANDKEDLEDRVQAPVRQVVFSPDAARRKTQAMRLLQDYRELDSGTS